MSEFEAALKTQGRAISLLGAASEFGRRLTAD
jgi:hypothetical protein